MQIVVPYCVRTAGGQSRGKGSQPQAAKAEQGQPQAADKEAPWRTRPATGGRLATGGQQRSAVASKASHRRPASHNRPTADQRGDVWRRPESSAGQPQATVVVVVVVVVVVDVVVKHPVHHHYYCKHYVLRIVLTNL